MVKVKSIRDKKEVWLNWTCFLLVMFLRIVPWKITFFLPRFGRIGWRNFFPASNKQIQVWRSKQVCFETCCFFAGVDVVSREFMNSFGEIFECISKLRSQNISGGFSMVKKTIWGAFGGSADFGNMMKHYYQDVHACLKSRCCLCLVCCFVCIGLVSYQRIKGIIDFVMFFCSQTVEYEHDEHSTPLVSRTGVSSGTCVGVAE